MTSRNSTSNNSKDIPDLSLKLKDILSVVVIPPDLQDLIVLSISSEDHIKIIASSHGSFTSRSFKQTLLQKYEGKRFGFNSEEHTIEAVPLCENNSRYLALAVSKKELSKETNDILNKIFKVLTDTIEGVVNEERRHLFQNLVENLGDMIFELDENGIFTYVNPATVEVTGYSAKELQEMHYLQIVDAEELEGTIEFFKAKIKEKEEYTYHQCDIIKKNDQKKISVGLKLQFIYDGKWVKKVYAVARDITELLEARRELQDSEEKYRLLAENSKDLIILHELDGKYKYVSPSIHELLGYKASELIANDPYQLIHPDDVEQIFDNAEQRKNLIDKGIKKREYRIQHKNGNYVWFESYTKPVYDQSQNLIAFQSFSRDISQQKENEEKLKVADLRLSQYKEGLKSINEITSNSDLSAEQQIEEALGVCTEFLGMETGILSRIEDEIFQIDFIYSNEENKFHRNQILRLDDTFSEVVFKKEDILAVENIGSTIFKVHPAKSLFEIESYIGIPYYVAGAKRGSLAFHSSKPRKKEFDQNEIEFVKLLSRWIGDLLQQQEYERNLISDKMILQAFASSAPAAIAMFDEDIRYITASDKWYSDYGLENEYIIGKSYFEVFPKIGRDWEEIFQRALTGKIEHNDQDLIERENGEIQWIKWEVRPWYKKIDTVGGLIMYTEDITQQKEQQLQLKIAKRKAEQASKAKEQFLSTMSHEIRTPLNAIIGMTDLMMMEEQKPDQMKHLKLLKFSGENLLVLINDILDFNKIEAGKLEFEIVDFNLKRLLSRIHDTLHGLAQRKKLDFNLNWDDNIPEYVKGDAVRMNQVITNLINNAIKFTEEGYITLKARLMHKEADVCLVKFEVKDTGIGIPEEKIDAVFQSFEQASANTTRKYGGSGLGLAIVKRILEYMNSSIKVHSTVGHGSTFYFELELPIGESIEKKILSDKGEGAYLRKDLSILIAEDNEANRVVIESLFRKWNIDHDFAFNGLEAVKKSDSKKYHLILMDLQMPEMDGYEATRVIRAKEDPYFNEIPIVALTASVMSNVLEKTKEVGMNSYISKPFDPANLRDVIARYTYKKEDVNGVVEDEQEAYQEVTSPEASTDDFPYLRSLIGDDTEALKEIVKTTLDSIRKSTVGVKEGIASDDIKKVRAELHVLRPNLHNLELGKLTENLPQIRELNEVSRNQLAELIKGIEKELTSERLNIFIE